MWSNYVHLCRNICFECFALFLIRYFFQNSPIMVPCVLVNRKRDHCDIQAILLNDKQFYPQRRHRHRQPVHPPSTLCSHVSRQLLELPEHVLDTTRIIVEPSLLAITLKLIDELGNDYSGCFITNIPIELVHCRVQRAFMSR